MSTTDEPPSGDPLLQPFQLKHLSLRNRVFSSSHEPAYSEGGMPTERYRLYHVEKAKGGIGMTMTAGSAVVAEDSPPGLRQPPRLPRRDRAVAAGDDRRGPRPRRGLHDPAHSPGPAHRVGPGRLAARGGSVTPAGARPPVHPQGGGGLGHRADRRAVRGCGRAHAGRGHGRHRDRVLRPSVRPVLVAAHEPSHGRVGWLVREPAALRLGRAPGHAGAGGHGLHRRDPHGRRRADRGRHRRPDRAGDPAAAGSRRPDRLRERHPGSHRQRRRAHRRHPHPRHAVRPPPGLRRAGPRQHQPRRAPRLQGGRCGHRPPRHPRGQGGPGGHDQGPSGRPPPGAQDHGGPGGRDPPLRRRHLLPGPHLRGRRGAVHPQRRHQPRGRRCPTRSPPRRGAVASWWSVPVRRAWRRPGWRASEATT